MIIDHTFAHSSGTSSSATILMILISGLMAGPAVSLYGSPAGVGVHCRAEALRAENPATASAKTLILSVTDDGELEGEESYRPSWRGEPSCLSTLTTRNASC
jgi:hypothetical protein